MKTVALEYKEQIQKGTKVLFWNFKEPYTMTGETDDLGNVEVIDQYGNKSFKLKSELRIIVPYSNLDMKLVRALHIFNNEVVEVYTVDNVQDIKRLLDAKVITPLHVNGMTILLERGRVMVNKKGGYCNEQGVFKNITPIS